MRKENYLDVLKPNLYMSAWKLKHGQHWDFQQDNDSKYPYKEVAKWLKGNNDKVTELLSYNSDLNPIKDLWTALGVAEQAGQKTWQSCPNIGSGSWKWF